ncbi:MAG: flavodoxin family protein [Desulfovibrionaceae bacterium]|nr:flavodoxin family protein [Desulfovibrionaceae bacterium]
MATTPQEPQNGQVNRRKLLSFAGIGSLLALAGGVVYKHFSATSAVKVESFMTSGSGRKKNILVLTGSGRKQGNSDLLAEAFVKGALEASHNVKVFHSGREPMQACRHCGGCWSRGKPCVIDDSFEKLFPWLEQAELLVFCSPLYWYNFSGHIKCAMDRMYPYSQKNRLRDMQVRETMLLMCGQSHFLRSFAGPAEAYRQMIGYKHWNDRGRLFVTGVDEYGEIVKDKALVTAEEMGRNA